MSMMSKEERETVNSIRDQLVELDRLEGEQETFLRLAGGNYSLSVNLRVEKRQSMLDYEPSNKTSILIMNSIMDDINFDIEEANGLLRIFCLAVGTGQFDNIRSDIDKFYSEMEERRAKGSED